MKGNPILYKTLVIGVIVLFIGLGVQPAIADVSNISISDDEDECNLCPKVSNQHIVRIKSLIDRLDTLNTKLSKMSKLNPELEENYKEISDKISTLTKMKEKYLSDDEWDFPFIRLTLCIILTPFYAVSLSLWISIAFFVVAPYYLGYVLLSKIINTILWIPSIILGYIWWEINNLMDDLGCIPPDH